jgi:hypothetical protein
MNDPAAALYAFARVGRTFGEWRASDDAASLVI